MFELPSLLTMGPKLTRKYPSEQKTTTPEGYREYKKLQMREIRQKERKLNFSLKETLDSSQLQRTYDRSFPETEPVTPKPIIHTENTASDFQSIVQGFDLILSTFELQYRIGHFPDSTYPREKQLEGLVKQYQAFINDMFLILAKPNQYERDKTILELLIGMEQHVLDSIDYREKWYNEKFILEVDKWNELREERKRNIKWYSDTLIRIEKLQKGEVV